MCVCLFVCGHSNVRLTTPPVLMLWGTQGYLWLPYDLTEVINLIGERLEPKNIFFKKILYVIPSALVSFLPYYCHSIRITVIPSGSLSFLPNYCHSFHIGVIPSEYCYSFRITVIPSGSLSFIPDYCHSFHIGVIPSKYCYSFQIIQRITNTN